MRDFRESLIISSGLKAFDVPDHQVAVQGIVGLSRKFFLVNSKQDLENMKDYILVERVLLIPMESMRRFTVSCPSCGKTQFISEGIMQCPECESRFKTPGYR